jgi:hypothetical protein
MSDTPNAPPSVDPANDDSLLGMANTILRKFLQRVDDMLPARVVSFDREANRVTLAPMVAMLTTAGAQVARAQVAEVPVFRFGGGGMLISFNLKPGDFGWMKASDRDISMFLQSWGGGPPNTLRMHTFEDAMFFPDAMRDVEFDPEDEENAVFQTLDGKYRVAIWADKVKVTGDDTSAEFKTGEITLIAPVAVTVQAPLINLNGSVNSNGGPGTPDIALTAANSITLNAPTVTIQGRTFLGHQHNNVQPGAGNSGGVV